MGPLLKPSLVEKKVIDRNEFAGLSDKFKEIFGNDKADRKMILPISGYGGHRRGERS